MASQPRTPTLPEFDVTVGCPVGYLGGVAALVDCRWITMGMSSRRNSPRPAGGHNVQYLNAMNSDWDDVSFVISSQYRIAVLRRLADGPATPSRIANDADLGIAHISRALQGLRDRDLVELLVSEDRRKGRVYGVTEKGSQVWDKIEA